VKGSLERKTEAVRAYQVKAKKRRGVRTPYAKESSKYILESHPRVVTVVIPRKSIELQIGGLLNNVESEGMCREEGAHKIGSLLMGHS